MLVYIIDGFNLIHKVPSLKASSFPQRALIDYISQNHLTGSRNNQVIIVFDGNMPDGVKRREAGFEIMFSGQASADDLITTKVSSLKPKSEVVVVSDDRQIKDFIKRQGARSCGVLDFIKKKQKPKSREKDKDISYSLQYEITQELRKSLLDKHCDQ